MEQISQVKIAIKTAQKELDEKVVAKYAALVETHVETQDFASLRTLVVEDKWLAALAAAVQGELERVSPF